MCIQLVFLSCYNIQLTLYKLHTLHTCTCLNYIMDLVSNCAQKAFASGIVFETIASCIAQDFLASERDVIKESIARILPQRVHDELIQQRVDTIRARVHHALRSYGETTPPPQSLDSSSTTTTMRHVALYAMMQCARNELWLNVQSTIHECNRIVGDENTDNATIGENVENVENGEDESGALPDQGMHSVYRSISALASTISTHVLGLESQLQNTTMRLLSSVGSTIADRGEDPRNTIKQIVRAARVNVHVIMTDAYNDTMRTVFQMEDSITS